MVIISSSFYPPEVMKVLVEAFRAAQQRVLLLLQVVRVEEGLVPLDLVDKLAGGRLVVKVSP